MMIDVHAHTFNAAYVPIKGIIMNRAGWSEDAAQTAADIFNAIVRLDPFDGQETLDLNAIDDSEAEIQLEVATPIESVDEVAVDWAARSASERAMDEVIEPALQRASALGLIAPDPRLLSLEAAALEPQRLNLLKFLWTVIREGKGWGRWFILLLSREQVIVRKMYKHYGDKNRFVVHMMDMDNFYPGRSKLEFVSEQIPRVARMAAGSANRILPFVAFDPTRENALDIVSHALSLGFRGVKFYPPSGYRPLNNQPDDVPPGQDAGVIERRIRELYTLCLECDVPIFAHCQPKGMDARPGSGELSHPDGWESVLRMHPDLRLCIGHAGGETAWFEHDRKMTPADHAWRLKTVDLCCRYPNVYCEVGHLDDLLNRDARARFRGRLRDASQTPGDYRLEDKIMYGSDYHLLIRTSHFDDIPKFLKEDFEWAGMSTKKFFEDNAESFLGL